jgi:hypothetical protein
MITNSGIWGICPNLLNPDTLKGPPEQVPQATGWTSLMNYKPTSKNEARGKVSEVSMLTQVTENLAIL